MANDKTNRGPYPIFDYKLPKIRHNLEEWGRQYIQGMAALDPAPIRSIDALIGALRIKRPMQRMSDKDMEVFLKLTSKLLHESGFGYSAIEQGIKNLLLRDEGRFFPTDQVLQKYIYPINLRHKRRMDLLGDMLEQL